MAILNQWRYSAHYDDNSAPETGVFRAPTITVCVLRRPFWQRETNKYEAQYFISIEVDRCPAVSLGPYDRPITIPEAMQLAAAELRMNHPNLAASF